LAPVQAIGPVYPFSQRAVKGTRERRALSA
jgi:hypothetical protein